MSQHQQLGEHRVLTSHRPGQPAEDPNGGKVRQATTMTAILREEPAELSSVRAAEIVASGELTEDQAAALSGRTAAPAGTRGG